MAGLPDGLFRGPLPPSCDGGGGVLEVFLAGVGVGCPRGESPGRAELSSWDR